MSSYEHMSRKVLFNENADLKALLNEMAELIVEALEDYRISDGCAEAEGLSPYYTDDIKKINSVLAKYTAYKDGK